MLRLTITCDDRWQSCYGGSFRLPLCIIVTIKSKGLVTFMRGTLCTSFISVIETAANFRMGWTFIKDMF